MDRNNKVERERERERERWPKKETKMKKINKM
jgi:hypothetical protein